MKSLLLFITVAFLGFGIDKDCNDTTKPVDPYESATKRLYTMEVFHLDCLASTGYDVGGLNPKNEQRFFLPVTKDAYNHAQVGAELGSTMFNTTCGHTVTVAAKPPSTTQYFWTVHPNANLPTDTPADVVAQIQKSTTKDGITITPEFFNFIQSKMSEAFTQRNWENGVVIAPGPRQDVLETYKPGKATIEVRMAGCSSVFKGVSFEALLPYWFMHQSGLKKQGQTFSFCTESKDYCDPKALNITAKILSL